MSVIITITFDVGIDKSRAAAEAIPEVMAKIGEANAKHGGKALMVLKRDGAFMDINEYPSADAYAAFKVDAQEAIAEFEARAGLTSTDHAWDIVSNSSPTPERARRLRTRALIAINICLRGEGARAAEVVDAAVACEEAGFAGSRSPTNCVT